MQREPLQDFIDFLTVLNQHKVQYVIVGAHAMAYWGYVRATGDIDIFLARDSENTKRLMESLAAFGAPMRGVSAEDFQKKGTVFQLGVPPVRIDLLNHIDGVTSKAVFSKSVIGKILNIRVKIIGLNELIKNKKSTGRDKDKMDVGELSKIKARKK